MLLSHVRKAQLNTENVSPHNKNILQAPPPPHIASRSAAHDDVTLTDLSAKINVAIQHVGCTYIEIGKLLIIARQKCKQNGIPFYVWCEQKIRKVDGNTYSQKTLENYMYLAGDPERVEKQKFMQRNNIQAIRTKALTFDSAKAIASLFTKKTTVQDQYDILMTAYSHANEKAKEKFLESIGAKM